MKRVTYTRSLGETSIGRFNAPNVQMTIGGTSFCPTGYGSPVIINPIVTIRNLLSAVTQLTTPVLNTLLGLERELQNIQTIINYYAGNCGPQFQSQINAMLPTNLRAYTALSWNYAECNILGRNFPQAVQTIQSIVSLNPGNVEVLARSKYYHVMIRRMENASVLGYKVSTSDLDLLAEVVASGTMFSAAACHELRILDPLRISTCINLSNTREAVKESTPLIDTQEIRFMHAPNPFSESTRIEYYLPETVKNASLEVFDIRGRLVKAVELNIQQQEIILSADDMEDGLYLYHIVADEVPTLKKKLVVIR